MKQTDRYMYDDELDDEEQRVKKGKKKTSSKNKKKKNKIKRFFIKFFIILFIILAILAGVIVAYGYDKFSKINIDTSIDKNEIDINEGVVTTGYMNIVLYGVDARDQDDSYSNSLSDAIMIVSINQDTKKVRIASVYRDTYLHNPKKKTFDKITHAYMAGGPALSMSILNTNLDLNLTDYVAVNFNVVQQIIDAVGGIDMEITADEARDINQYIREINSVTGSNSAYINKAGSYHLDGTQATAYSRVRHTAGGDWKRTERQRIVIDKTFEKIKTLSLGKLNSLADLVLQQISTNIETKQILYLLTQAASYEIEDSTGWPFRPADYQPAGVYYTVPRNLEQQVIELHEFLFDKEDYVVSAELKAISDKLIKQTGLK